MRYNYYCNGEGFDDYDEARAYAEVLLVEFRIYKCIFTRDEIQSMIGELV
jgi:hypothetical protein